MKKIFLGLLVLVAISGINRNFGGFFLISIICTAGVSLLIWFPLAFVIGSIILKLIQLFTEKKENAPKVKGQISKNQQALANYIHREREDGFNDEQILSLLKGQGWTEGEIKEALNIAISKL